MLKFTLNGFIAGIIWLVCVDYARAHHVLGRPVYSQNEVSNTPPHMRLEVNAGDFLVTGMVYPAFPRPDEPGRISYYVTNSRNGTPFDGKVTFWVRDDSWKSWLGLQNAEEILGTQPLDDNVFRQDFVFSEEGEYIISAEFRADGEPYKIDFPLRVGVPSPWGPIGITVTVILTLMVGVTLVQRRRTMTAKNRDQH